METFARSYKLALESLKVLRMDPELVLFPIISFFATVVAALAIGGVGLFAGLFNLEKGITLANVLLLFIFYFCAYFIAIYFQVGLVASVQIRLGGDNPTLSAGLRAANRRLGPIASWAVIAAVVGLVLRLLEGAAQRNTQGFGRIVAQIAIGLVGMAWSLAAFFVIPVLAAEGIGGFGALKRSVAIIKQRWGEAVVGHGGIGLVFGLAAVVWGVVFGFVGLWALASGGTLGAVVGVPLVITAVVGVVVLLTLSATLQSIYTAVVFQYATEGKTGDYFSPALLQDAFRSDRRSRDF